MQKTFTILLYLLSVTGFGAVNAQDGAAASYADIIRAHARMGAISYRNQTHARNRADAYAATADYSADRGAHVTGYDPADDEPVASGMHLAARPKTGFTPTNCDAPADRIGTFQVAQTITSPNGCSESNSIEIFVGTMKTPETSLAKPGLRIYPNPSTGLTFIEWDTRSGNSATVTVCNLHGRAVLKTQIEISQGTHALDLSSLIAGMYVVNIRNAHFAQSEKLMVIR